MNIYDMEVGKRYLVGDSLGYDLIICLEQGCAVLEANCKGVRVRFVANGAEDVFFEAPGCPFTTYVEPR